MGRFQVEVKNLERGPGGLWRVAKYIPERLQKTMGCKVIRKSLGTKDQAQAIRLRDAAVAELNARIDAAEEKAKLNPAVLRNADTLADLLAKERARVADLEAQLATARENLEWGTRQIERMDKRHPALSVKPTVHTFSDAVEAFIESRIASSEKTGKPWRDPAASAKDWADDMRGHAKSIANKPVDQITTADIMGILANHPPQKVRPRIESILHHAKALTWRTGDNPAAVENLAVPVTKPTIRHYASMPFPDVPAFFTTLSKTDTAVTDAMRFVILTVCRKSEVGGARWEEIDLDTATWTIPAERMKTHRAHVVPLSDAALAILRTRKKAERKRDGGFVFPGRDGNAGLSHVAIDSMLARIKCEYTTHGFRSSFRDWCAENGKNDTLAEFALSHVKHGVEGAYYRTSLLEQRRVLMQEWSDYVLSVDAA